MSPLRLIAGRSFTRLMRAPTSLFGVCGFLALSGGFFLRALYLGDGGLTPISVHWALAAVPFLPVLAALLTMGLVAEDRASGRLDEWLVTPIRDLDYVLGRYFGAYGVVLIALILYALMPWLVLPCCAPRLQGSVSVLDLVPALGALAMQGVLWCAAGLLASACCRRAATAAFLSLILMLALPHAAYRAATIWYPLLRARLAEMPFDAHIADFATGLYSTSTVAFYVLLAAFALLVAIQRVSATRLCGRGVGGKRFTVHLVEVLAFVFTGLTLAVLIRLDIRFEGSLRAPRTDVSARTRQILAETHGVVQMTCFVPRSSESFRMLARLMRGLETAAGQEAGAQLTVSYVDPRWDLGEATRLVREGVPEGSLVFRQGRRKVLVRADELFAVPTNHVQGVSTPCVFAAESVCASALQRLTSPARRTVVYGTCGHGEARFDDYDPVTGLSGIARELRRDGYELRTLDVAAAAVPEDCAALIVAGPRTAFSRAEKARLDAWLRGGGRLMVMASAGQESAANDLLADWGARLLPFTVVSPQTLTGANVVANDLGDHVITCALMGSSVVFEGAAPLVPGKTASTVEASAQEVTGTADRITFRALVRTDDSAWGERDVRVKPWHHDAEHGEPGGPLVLAAALERGGERVAREVGIRPTRLVVVGDASLVSNGALNVRANANPEFFLNALSWLAGLDAQTASRAPGDMVRIGLVRDGWRHLAVCLVFGFPMAVAGVWLLYLLVRRRRTR